MAKVRPIWGLRYGDLIGDKSLVVAPPYDVISKVDQIKLHARHPMNIVWVDFAMERGTDSEGKYRKANDLLEELISENVLIREEDPALYYYEQEFELEGRGRLVRTGFICGLWLEKFGEGSVFPHERTLLTPKIDRLNLMKHTKTATSPIFGIYDDDENAAKGVFRNALSRVNPDIAVWDDGGVLHRMWVLTDERLIEEVAGILNDKRIYIADGHHRYETALAYRDWMRERIEGSSSSSWNYVMIFLSASGDDGLVILPTHRGVHGINHDKISALVEGLKEYFVVEKREGSPKDLADEVSLVNEGEHRLGLVDERGTCYLLKIDDVKKIEEGGSTSLPRRVGSLDVSILHGIVLERILGISPEEITSGEKVRFYKDMNRGLDDLEKGTIQLFFYLNPVSMTQFIDVSNSGFILPQKTTYFYPKILTGLVLYPVGEKDSVG